MIPKVRVMTMNTLQWEVQCDVISGRGYVEHIWQVIEKRINERKKVYYIFVD